MAELEFSDQIIIKRRANTEMESPKGGVWKIAFADFMTAMMCFFLVMWLINAANEDTRKAVASYFNPVRLAELNRKGLMNQHNQPEVTPKGEQTTEESTPGEDPTGEAKADLPREALFKDPYKVLAEIAGEAPPGQGVGAALQAAATSDGSGADVSAAGAGPFRDPFDPEFSKEAPSGGSSVASAADNPAAAPAEALADEGATQAGPLRLSLPESEPPAAQIGARLPMSSASDGNAPLAGALLPAVEVGETSRAELQAELSEAVKKESRSNHGPSIAVEKTGEGMTISLTDDVDFGMFSVGSAQPQPQMIRIMQRIAAILKTRTGTITVRGHTDARPFRNGNYDNWRLSTDRAQMAYYMLVRGGLDEKRVAAIEGYADRKLKVPGDPEAARNRRIEILLSEAPS